jgi:RNA polymerase sigma-70 factor (ECF subfamily)
MDEDPQLLERARQFDQQALAEIYDRFSPAIYAYAMRLSGDSELAEECAAETFSRLLRALQNGGGPQQHLRAYLYRVAHNWMTDRFRRDPQHAPLDPNLRASQDSEPHIAAADEIERQQVRAALALLTPDQRQVIALKYLQELDHDEIAAALGKPVGAVKALQHRALAALRRILEEAAPQPQEPGPPLALEPKLNGSPKLKAESGSCTLKLE